MEQKRERECVKRCRQILAGALEKLGAFVGEEEMAGICELIVDTMGGGVVIITILSIF